MTEQTEKALPRVAVLGTGTMGAGMARNIAAAGLAVKVWNRTRDKAEAVTGAEVADTPAGAVEDADVVVTMLFDTASVRSVMQEAREGLGDDVVWVQSSTIGLDGTDELAMLAEDLGVTFVDAPVLGTKKPAEDGTLTVLASVDDSTNRERVAPVLDAVGASTHWIGPAGGGTRLKLALNAWILTMTEGIAHSLALTKALGLDPQLFLDVVADGPLDAPYVHLKGSAMLSGDLAPSFGLDGAAKDADLILAADERVEVSSALMTAVRDNLRRALSAGHDDLDMAATYLTQGTR